jgi:hypothetical protein
MNGVKEGDNTQVYFEITQVMFLVWQILLIAASRPCNT